MKTLGGLIGLVGFAVLGVLVWAGAQCSVDTARATYYHLELTVPATFCRDRAGDPSCASFPKVAALQLHGLWVDYADGPAPRYPAGTCSGGGCQYLDHPPTDGYCRVLPEPPGLYASPAWKEKHGYFAGAEKCLERHEWVKHGTCSPMEAPAWGAWSLDKTAEIAGRIGIKAYEPLSQAAIDAAVRTNLPELDGAVTFTCKKDALASLSVDYAWGQTPGAVRKRPEGRNRYNGCRKTIVLPSRP